MSLLCSNNPMHTSCTTQLFFTFRQKIHFALGFLVVRLCVVRPLIIIIIIMDPQRMDFLRGMKFMRRKEEAKRLSNAQQSVIGSSQVMPTGSRGAPKIVTDASFPAEMAVLGRRRYLLNHEAPALAPAADAVTIPQEHAEPPLDSAPLPEEAVAASSAEAKAVPTQPRRFTLQESVRAPKLPKSLSEAQHRKRTEAAEDNDNEAEYVPKHKRSRAEALPAKRNVRGCKRNDADSEASSGE